MKLSIVSTVYKSSSHIGEFIERIKSAADDITNDYELILVNDGSPDNSLQIALEARKSDNRIRIIDLSRNFGHHRAVMTGLKYAMGAYVFLIDCDLEEDPQLLKTFFSRIVGQQEADVFYGVAQTRKGGLFKRLGGDLFYRLFNRLSTIQLPRNPLTIRIMTKRYVAALTQHTEEELFLAGLFELTGFKQEQIVVAKTSRKDTSYGVWKRVRLLVTGITSFSSFPLLVSFYLGNVISFIAVCYAFYLAARKLITPDLVIEGWTSLMISVWFLGGVILTSCGMIGLYLSRVYYEVKRRPNFIVREFYGIDSVEKSN